MLLTIIIVSVRVGVLKSPYSDAYHTAIYEKNRGVNDDIIL